MYVDTHWSPACIQRVTKPSTTNSVAMSIDLFLSIHISIDLYILIYCLADVDLSGCAALRGIGAYEFEDCPLEVVTLSGCSSIAYIGTPRPPGRRRTRGRAAAPPPPPDATPRPPRRRRPRAGPAGCGAGHAAPRSVRW